MKKTQELTGRTLFDWRYILLLSSWLVVPCRAFVGFQDPILPLRLFATKNEPSSNDAGTIHAPTPTHPKLTVILPAFNESLRIGETLSLYHGFLSSSPHWCQTSEILVVDDGSTDGTSNLVETISASLMAQATTYSKNKNRDEDNQIKIQSTASKVLVQCISLECNQGKGAALTRGIEYVADTAKSEQPSIILIADADASADITCLDNIFRELQSLLTNTDIQSSHTTKACSIDWSVPALVVGRRTYKDKLSMSRGTLRWGFRTAVRVLCGDLGVSDTQCGFKLMTLTAARQLYSDLYLKGWSHDVEVLYRARLLTTVPVAECNVRWQDKVGSKLVTSAGGTLGASFQMLLEIAQLRVCYTLGIWKLPQQG